MTDEKQDIDVVVKVDARLKKQWEEADKRLKEADAKGGTAWHLKWSEVLNIVTNKPALYLAGGFATDGEFYEEHLKETRQVCSTSLRIVQLTTPTEVALYKPTKLALAIRYIEASSKKTIENRDEVEFEKLRIQLTQSGKKVTKSLSEVSSTELREAISQLAGRPKKAPASADMKLVLELLKSAGVEGVKATTVGGAFNLRVPFDGLAAVAKVLSDFDSSDKS